MSGKSILITGCSSGIGLAAAVALKDRGYRVFATARKEVDVKMLQDRGFESIKLDVSDSTSIKTAIDQILSWTSGTLDAVFNNAGYAQPGAVEDITREMAKEQFETNVFGPMELIRLLLPIMRKQGHGRIVQNSSILGVVCVPFTGAYNASKHALEGFTGTLRLELRNTNIHVICINPGPIESKMRTNAFSVFKKNPDDFVASVHKNAYKKMEKKYQPTALKPLSTHPDAVVKHLVHALESKRPRAHYFVGIPAHLTAILRRILPDWLLDAILARA